MKNKNSLKSDAKITVNPHLHDFWFPQRYLDNSITGADFQSKSLRYRMDSRGKNYRKTLVMTESPIVLNQNESFLGINTLPTENCLTSESLSIKTIIDKQEISKNLNQRSLELSVKLGDSYKSDKDIKRITQNNIKKQSNHNRKTQKRNSIALYRTTQRIFPKKRVKSIPVDTSLNVKEVKMIMDELKSINQSEE